MKLIKNAKYVITDNDILENVSIEFDKNIERIFNGEYDKPNKKYDEIIEGHDLIISPGFINAHTHAAMIGMRGYQDDKRLFEWLEVVNEIEQKMDPAIVYLASKLAIMEMLMTGTVGFVDQYFYEKETAKAAREAGIYAMLGTPFTDTDINKRKERVIEFMKEKSETIIPIINPHSIYTCSRDTLKLVKELSENYGLRVNIHAAETRKEVMDCYKNNNMFVIEYLDSLGLLKNSILAHVGWITKDEILLIEQNNATVVNNPASNMKLATGAFFPYVELKKRNVNIALGTDGSASNNSLNMFSEMKFMALLHKHSYWDASVISAQDAFNAATKNGYKVFGKDMTIKEGNPATFIAINKNELSLMPLRKDNLISNIVYSYNGTVDYNIINGKTTYSKDMKQSWKKEGNEISDYINSFF